jgi:hypothetical protein
VVVVKLTVNPDEDVAASLATRSLNETHTNDSRADVPSISVAVRPRSGAGGRVAGRVAIHAEGGRGAGDRRDRA